MNKGSKKLHLIFDSCSLITAAKFSVDNRLILDVILEIAEISIPEEIRLETTKELTKYKDAKEIQTRIADGKIIVKQVLWDKNIFKNLEDYNIDLGEKEAILLYLENKDFDFLVVDDFLAAIICSRFKINHFLLLDLIVHCVNSKLIDPELAIKIVNSIRSRYHIGFVNHTLSMITARGNNHV